LHFIQGIAACFDSFLSCLHFNFYKKPYSTGQIGCQNAVLPVLPSIRPGKKDAYFPG